MKCPFCQTPDTKVVDSRLNQTGDITRRRRACPRCEGRFTTYERVEEVMPLIIKKDGRREPYNRDKVLGGLSKCTQKRPVQTEQLEAIATRIEKRLISLGLKEVPSKVVGQMLMKELKPLDQVAYVRFASVYREFQDFDEFIADLKEEVAQQPPVDDQPLFPFAASEGEENA